MIQEKSCVYFFHNQLIYNAVSLAKEVRNFSLLYEYYFEQNYVRNLGIMNLGFKDTNFAGTLGLHKLGLPIAK